MADARKDEKTNIQVGIRVRPCIKRELESHKKIVMKTNENRIFSTANDKPAISYQFDKVFGEAISTEQIYETLGSPIVEYVVAGFHGTLLAYGQTASGKTHTIMGDPGDEGIIPRALKDLFHNIHKCENREFLIRASYLEIYNEVITDLLKTGNQPEAKVQIRTDESGVVYVDNLTEFNITNFEEGLQLVKQGQENRSIGKTLMNERSSRSHVIFRLVIESREWQDPNSTDIDLRPVYSAELNLVDLAGSERVQLTGAQGQRFKESTYINQSLLTLGTVIARLCEKTRPDHVPYRDSKLTRLLQNSLGGNARTAMICCVSPVVYEETVQTLKFAARAKNVQNKPTVNEVFEGNSQMKKQMMEIRDLKNKIKELEDVQHGDLLMEQEIIAEKQMFRKKIEAQEERIQELLRQVVHGRNTVIQESTTEKYKRRQTWCPGSLQKAFQGNRLITIHESDNDSPMVSKKKKLANFRNKTLSPVVSKDRLSDVFVKSDAMECSFERNEYNLLKEEFEEYKATTVKDLSQAEEWLREKEMEAEKLKNQLRDRNVECERLRDTCKTDETSNSQKAAEIEALHQELRLKEEKIMSLKDQTENEEWQTVLSNFLEQEKEKNQTLSQQLESLRLEFANLSKTNEQVMTEKSDLQERLIVVENDLNDYKTQQSTQEQQQTSTQQWEQKISALEEELDLNRELIQTLRTDKNQLEYEKQELLAAQMEQAVSEQSKNLADQALSNVQIAELQENNQQLITKNEKLEKDASAALEQVAQITENVKDHDSKLESLLAEIEQHKEDKACLQIELDRISKDRDALAMDQQVMDYERQNGELEKLRKDHINLQSDVGTLKDVIESQEDENKLLQQQIDDLLKKQQENLSSTEEDRKDALSKVDIQVFERQIENLESKLKTALEEKEDLVAGFNSMKQEFITADFEKTGDVERIEVELLECKRKLQSKEELLSKEKENADSVSHKLQELEKNTETKQSQWQEMVEKLEAELNYLKAEKNVIGTSNGEQHEFVAEVQLKLDEQSILLQQKIEIIANLLEKSSTLEENNLHLQTAKEEKESQLEELSKTNQNLQSEIKELKENASHIETGSHTNDEVIELRQKLTEQEELLRQKIELVTNLENDHQNFQNVFVAEKEKVTQLEERNFVLQTDKEEKESQLEELSKTNQNLQSEIKELKETLSEVGNETDANSNDEVIELRQKLTEQEELLRQKIELVTNLENDHQNFQNVFVAEKVKVTQLEERNFVLQTDKEEKESQLEELSQTNQNLQSEIKELKEAMSEVGNETDSNLKADEVIELRRKLAEYEESLQQKMDMLHNMENEHQNFQNVYNTEKEKVTQLEERNFVLQTDKEDKENQLEELSKTNQNLQSEIKELKETMSQIENNTLTTASVIELREKISEQETLLAEKSSQIELMVEEQEQFQKIFTEEKEKSSLLEERNFILQSEKEAKEEEVESTSQTIEHLRQELKESKENIVKLETEIQAKSEEIDSKHTEAETASKEENKSLKAHNDNLIVELNTLQRDLDVLQYEKEQLTSTLQQVEAQAKKTENEVVVGLNDKIQTLEQSLKDKEALVEQVEQSRVADKRGLETRVKELNAVVQQYDQLSQFNNQLRTKISDLEENLFSLQESLESNKETMEESKTTIENLEQTKGSLLSQVEAMKSDLLTKEDAVTSLVHTKETMTQMIQDLETQKEELVGDKDALQEEVEKERKQIESLDSKIQELDQALLKEKESCEEERSLCKSAYERKASEKEAQATELVRCMKRLQSDNVQLNETIEKLRQELDEKTRLNQVEQLSHEKVDELERKCEQLKNLYEEEVKELKDELLNMEKGLTEKENTMTTVSNENEAVKKELGDLQQKYEQSLTSNRNTSPLNNDSAETPKDDLKVLQNKLKLRLEDIEVYKNRIHEQDDEIKKLKSKKEELKDQMKRAITHFESVRRPSGNSSTEEWERLVTDLDKRVLRLNNSNTEITEKNRILKQKLESYSECLKSSQVKLQQQERLLKGSNELNKVQEELNKKANENERLKTGIQKAYSRMTKAETKEKETSSKMDRVTNGLNTAFERYKHYKGRCQTLDGEIKTLKQDLDEARSRLSPRSTTVEPHDTSSRALRSSSRTNQIASSSPQSTNPFLPPTKSTNQTSSSFASSKKISTSTGSLSDFHSMINKDTSKDSATTASDRLPSLSGFTDKAPGNLSDIIGNLQDDEEEDRSLFSLTSPVAKETRKETPEQPFASSILPTNKRKSPIFSTRSAFAVVDSTKENETQERKQAITSPEEVAKKRKSLETAESSQPRRRRISNFDTTPKKAGESECNQQ
uniref:Kinesin motor domain-containing protein n=1 Tax=Clytia hemisphaerica TaxID=252671 RepID=A0A7M5XFG7_9CNID